MVSRKKEKIISLQRSWFLNNSPKGEQSQKKSENVLEKVGVIKYCLVTRFVRVEKQLSRPNPRY